MATVFGGPFGPPRGPTSRDCVYDPSTGECSTRDDVYGDTTPPSVTLTAPADGSATNDSSPEFAGTGGTAAGDGAAVTVKVWSGASVGAGAADYTVSATRDGSTGGYSTSGPFTKSDASSHSTLSDGKYTARAFQSDAASNTGRSSDTPFTIDTTAVDNPPTAHDDTATVAQDGSAATVDVLSNDTDPDGGAKTIDSKTNGSHGTVAITHSGADLTYNPDAGYCNSQSGDAAETFTYTLNGGSTATVSVTVKCNDTDGDGIPDRSDPDIDGDGVPNSQDAFPLDPHESVDTDRDGIGNNADTDDDNDGVPDSQDSAPLDPTKGRPNGPPEVQTRLSISHRGRLPVKNAFVTVRLRCTGAAKARCIGALVLDPARGKTRIAAAAAPGRYGEAKFNIAAGTSPLIRIEATRMLLKALRKRHHLVTLVTGNYQGRNGGALRVERKLTLALPKH